MINSREFWNEAKSSFRLLISRPSFILTTAAPALIFSLILYMTRGDGWYGYPPTYNHLLWLV